MSTFVESLVLESVDDSDIVASTAPQQRSSASSSVNRQRHSMDRKAKNLALQIRQELTESHKRIMTLLENASSEVPPTAGSNGEASDRVGPLPQSKVKSAAGRRVAFDKKGDGSGSSNMTSVVPFNPRDGRVSAKSTESALSHHSMQKDPGQSIFAGRMSQAMPRFIRNTFGGASGGDSVIADSTTAPRGRLNRHATFLDPEAMKEKVRQAIILPSKQEIDFYREDSRWSNIARDQRFIHSALLVILLNGIWFSVDATYNDEVNPVKQHWIFQVADYAFCCFFTFEIVVRWLALKRKIDGFKDRVFVLDALLVGLMIFDLLMVFWLAADTHTDGMAGSVFRNTSFFKFVRLVRLLKMARLFRLVRALPEAYILVKGIMVAARSVGVTLVLLVGIIYIFAITFLQLAKGTALEATHFSSVGSAMSYLLLSGILPDQRSFVKDIADEDAAMGAVSLFFILLGSLTVMNMLIGILVQVVHTVSCMDKEQMEISHAKKHMELLVAAMDKNNNGMISIMEVAMLLEDDECIRLLSSVGVDVVGLVDMTDYIFGDRHELDEVHFMEAVLDMRGSNAAKVKDIVDLRKIVINIQRLVEEIKNDDKGGQQAKAGKAVSNSDYDDRVTVLPGGRETEVLDD